MFFTSIPAGEDGEFFDFFEIWDAHSFSEVCNRICCQLQEHVPTEILTTHTKKPAGFV